MSKRRECCAQHNPPKEAGVTGTEWKREGREERRGGVEENGLRRSFDGYSRWGEKEDSREGDCRGRSMQIIFQYPFRQLTTQ